MATGHILPGYGNPVTRLERARTAFPLDRQKLTEITERNVPALDQRTLDNIRNKARNAWLQPDYSPTTYNHFHNELRLDEPTQSRPSSPTRRHKPHPKPVFLINRLHYVPGYHNPDATMGKDVYRIDDSFSEEERQLRRHQREKFVPRHLPAAVDQFRDQPYVPHTDAIVPGEVWGAQAWLKVADDNHKDEVVNAVQDYREKDLFNVSLSPTPKYGRDIIPRPHTVIPSNYRWMKRAGVAESEQLCQILYGRYPPSTMQPLGSVGEPNTLQLRRQQEINAVKKHRYVHRPKRGEFLIHPEYPPTMPHHRID